MENEVSIPLLDSSPNSLEIINNFIPVFYQFLRTNPQQSIDILLAIHKNGNEKAGEIIKYLVSVSSIENLDIAKNKALSLTFEDLELSIKAFNCIRSAKIKSVFDLVQYTKLELTTFRNFGQKSINEIEGVLREKGLRFGMKFDT